MGGGRTARLRMQCAAWAVLHTASAAIILGAEESEVSARIVSKSKLWRDGDPTDGVCASKAAGFACVGTTCSSGPSPKDAQRRWPRH